MRSDELLRVLESLGPAAVRASQARFGICTDCAHGIRTPQLKILARTIGQGHRLAAALWDSRAPRHQ